MRWRKAAEWGHAFAQIYLGRAYALGAGVTQDWREAYTWNLIAMAAMANGMKEAAYIFRETNWRDYLLRSEIREAKKEAQKRLDAIHNQ